MIHLWARVEDENGGFFFKYLFHCGHAIEIVESVLLFGPGSYNNMNILITDNFESKKVYCKPYTR